MTKSQLLVKQVSPKNNLNVTSNKNELLKTVRLTSPHKQIAIRFNLLEIYPSERPLVFAGIFILSFNILNGYFYVSFNLVAIPTA